MIIVQVLIVDPAGIVSQSMSHAHALSGDVRANVAEAAQRAYDTANAGYQETIARETGVRNFAGSSPECHLPTSDLPDGIVASPDDGEKRLSSRRVSRS